MTGQFMVAKNPVGTLLLGKKEGYGYGVIRWECSEGNQKELTRKPKFQKLN